MKKLLAISFTLFFAIGVMIAFLPQIASTRWGTRALLHLLDFGAANNISTAKIKLSWKGAQSFQGVQWQSTEAIFKAPSMESSSPLLKLLFCKDFGIVQMKNPELYLSSVFRPMPLKQASFFPSCSHNRWVGTIQVSNGLIRYLDESISSIHANIEKTVQWLSMEGQALLGQDQQIQARARLSLQEKLFSAQGAALSSGNEQGIWEVGGKFQNGSWSEWRSGGKHLSTSLLAIAYRLFTKKELPLQVIFGKQADFLFNYDKGGPLEGFIIAPRAQAQLTGKLIDGILHLETPFQAELLLSHELNQTFFPLGNPYGISEISSEAPIQLKIAPQESAIPFTSWQPKNLSIHSGRLDLSTITCRLPGPLQELLNFLAQESLPLVPLHLWFSPLLFAANQGELTIKRADFLLNKTFHLCFWGSYDLIKSRLSLTLGITAPTVERLLKISGLPKEYVLQIPVTLSDNQLKINFKKAAQKLGKIMLWYQACQQGLSPPPFPEEKHPSPPPHSPLPWDLVLY